MVRASTFRDVDNRWPKLFLVNLKFKYIEIAMVRKPRAQMMRPIPKRKETFFSFSLEYLEKFV